MKDIRNFTIKELYGEMTAIGEPVFRANQLFLWLYKKTAEDFASMSNLSKPLIEKLKSTYYIGTIKPCSHLISTDRTEKFLFSLSDKTFIETVLIYARGRKTICLSTQVGCRYNCCFCASGSRGFTRNLSASEIVNQVLFLSHKHKEKITNFVFMGMGEPLDNYENFSKAVMIMNDPKALGIAARRITVSTCGIIPGIKRLKELGLQINLSISLHATSDSLRDKLMPVNKIYPLKELVKACEDFIAKKGRMITLEYVLIKEINDSRDDLKGLVVMAKRLRAKINLIPYSPISGCDFKTPSAEGIKKFINGLKENGVNTTVRDSKGNDIRAACGQLAGAAKDGI